MKRLIRFSQANEPLISDDIDLSDYMEFMNQPISDLSPDIDTQLQQLQEGPEDPNKALKYFKLKTRLWYDNLKLVGQWAIDYNWTIDLVNNIDKMINDAIAYNNEYRQAQSEAGRAPTNQLPAYQNLPAESTQKLINDILKDIDKTVKK